MFTVSISTYQGYKVHQVELSTLHLSVYEDEVFQPILKRDFERMIHPILLVPMTRNEYQILFDKHFPQLTPTPDKDHFLITWGGSQRCYLAKTLGHTHISAITIPTIKEAWKIQHEQRKSWTPPKAIK